jgi:hypothetical protein
VLPASTEGMSAGQFGVAPLTMYARRQKTLKRHTPYEYICKCWSYQPAQTKLNLALEKAGTKQLAHATR